MPKRLIYKLEIGAFSPKTIPMQRLSEYMADLAAVLGQTDRVHFEGLEEGSTVLNAVVESEAIPKVIERVTALERGHASEDLQKAFHVLDRRLASDNATGSLTAYADGQEKGALVLKFPGCERPKPVDYGIITERGSIEGVPTSITGRDSTKHIQLVDGDHVHTKISMNVDLAIRLMDERCVFRKVVRLYGMGRWQRDADGEWKLDSFKAENFEVLDDAPLRETLARLRAVEGSGWKSMDDPIGYLHDLSRDPDPDESLH